MFHFRAERLTTRRKEFSVSKETTRIGIIESLLMEILTEVIDDIVIAWIKKRNSKALLIALPEMNEEAWSDPVSEFAYRHIQNPLK